MPRQSSSGAKPPAPAHRLGGAEVPVHRIRDEGDRPSAVDGEPRVTAYAWGGKEVDPASPEAVAKKAYDPATGKTRYWLKKATSGPDRGHLFNPQSPTYAAGSLAKHVGQLGRGQYEFRKASARAFELYAKFIVHPHNPVNLRGAEREE